MNNISKIIKGHDKKVKSKSRDQNHNAIAQKNQNAQWKGSVKSTT